jgi:hypothetical protein
VNLRVRQHPPGDLAILTISSIGTVLLTRIPLDQTKLDEKTMDRAKLQEPRGFYSPHDPSYPRTEWQIYEGYYKGQAHFPTGNELQATVPR